MKYIDQGKVGLILFAIIATIVECDRQVVGWESATLSKGNEYTYELSNLSVIKKGRSLAYLEDPYRLYR